MWPKGDSQPPKMRVQLGALHPPMKVKAALNGEKKMFIELLSKDFVRVDEIARVLALAITSGKNVLLWGPAGHGKSEMVASALAEVASEDEVFVQSFGEGMDEATLWGGLDFAALEREHVLRYFPENSFLDREYAVFEEPFDAPSSVLLALKDTLTARKLRKGAQSFAMKTKVIIALTNKDPAEISVLGAAVHALIQRFPLQLEVKWPSYNSADYLELFAKVAPKLPGASLNGMDSILAEVMAKAGECGEIISPRTAVHALGVVKAAASLRSSPRVEKQDLLDLVFLPGMEAFAETLNVEIDAATERAEAEANLRKAEDRLRQIEDDLHNGDLQNGAGLPIKLLQVAKHLMAFQGEVASLKVTDALTERRKALREAIANKVLVYKILAAQMAPRENVRI